MAKGIDDDATCMEELLRYVEEEEEAKEGGGLADTGDACEVEYSESADSDESDGTIASANPSFVSLGCACSDS